MSTKSLKRTVKFGIGLVALILVPMSSAQELKGSNLSVTVNHDGSYQVAMLNKQTVFRSRVAAQVDHQWVRSSDYPRHRTVESRFHDELGSGRGFKTLWARK